MTSPESIFRNISSMEPLLPASGRSGLADLSVEIFQKSGELKSSLPSKIVRHEVSKLVCEMNSYYSNLIEGHKTLPRDIEKALKENFSNKEDDQRNQRLSVAHIKAEKAMLNHLKTHADTDVFSLEFICWLHSEFYSGIPKDDWFTTSKDGKRYPLDPGKLRDYNVDVGRHTPPDSAVLNKFMNRYNSFYAGGNIVSEGNAAPHEISRRLRHQP